MCPRGVRMLEACTLGREDALARLRVQVADALLTFGSVQADDAHCPERAMGHG